MAEVETRSLGAALDRLIAIVEARANADPGASYTAKLLHEGVTRCAQKLGEEGVEAALAAAASPESLAEESADLLYHLIVLLKAAGVAPDDVARVLNAREGRSGLAEKAARGSAD